MNFSAKTEYGVRLMVELGRRGDGGPVALKAIAAAESLPLSYLEHVVADLKRAGLVEASRGAHGGYRLARATDEIAMDEVVGALEGSLAPMDCFTHLPPERIACNHGPDGGRACATKLLWTRVQGGVVKALQGTTLAELVSFAERQEAAASPRAVA